MLSGIFGEEMRKAYHAFPVIHADRIGFFDNSSQKFSHQNEIVTAYHVLAHRTWNVIDGFMKVRGRLPFSDRFGVKRW